MPHLEVNSCQFHIKWTRHECTQNLLHIRCPVAKKYATDSRQNFPDLMRDAWKININARNGQDQEFQLSRVLPTKVLVFILLVKLLLFVMYPGILS